MTDKKVVFVAFAIEDEDTGPLLRDNPCTRHLRVHRHVGQAVRHWSGKKRSAPGFAVPDGIVALVSKNSLVIWSGGGDPVRAKEEEAKVRASGSFHDRTALADVKPSNGPGR